MRGRGLQSVDDGTIRLALPAEPEYSRVARTAVAGLALRLDFTYQAVEDLRLAIDEALILLLRTCAPEHRITIVFEPTADGLVVDLVATDAGLPLAPDERAQAQQRFEGLVGPIVDGWWVSDDDRRVHLEKRR